MASSQRPTSCHHAAGLRCAVRWRRALRLRRTELGVQVRFLQESDYLPEAAIFPLLEIPTGNESDGLGSGHVDAFLPLWLQTDFGDWTVYGGGGYGINPGAGNENWGFVGAVLQKQVTKNFLLGG